MSVSKSQYAWLVVAMLWFISFFNYADRQAIFSVFPLLEKEMKLDPVQLGMLGSSFAWVYGLMGPVAGFIVDRIRRKTAILAGLQTWSIICAATASAVTFPQLLFFRAAEGLGESIYYPASMSMLGDYHCSQTRSRAMGVHQTSVYLGTIGGGFFAGIIGQRYGWRWSFLFFGVLGILLGVVLTRYLREPVRGAQEPAPQQHEKISAREYGNLLSRTPTLIILMAAFVCSNFVAVVLLSWMPKFLYDNFHMSLAMSGLTATIYVQLASMIGSPVGGWLADLLSRRTKRGRMIVQAIGVFGGAPFVAMCGLSHSMATLILALTAWGFFKGLYDANIWASLFDVVPPHARGTACGAMNAVGWLGGGGTAPLLIGIIARQYNSLGFAIAIASVVYLAAGALLLTGLMLFVKKDAIRMDALALMR
ncbi:MAG: major facilitator superfamily 1 [Bryobacterales bacterium]|nr:major facilitator superfamily 1 [Bryobacterales bacterium]